MRYTFKEKIIGGIVSAIKEILKFFPLRIKYKFFERLGLLAYYLIKKRRRLTIENIKNAFPEKSHEEVVKIAKESYKTMGKMVMTSVFLKEITSEGNTYVENEKLLKKVSDETEKGIILVSLHMGGFEAGSYLAYIRDVYAVFRKQKNKKINDLMNKWRLEGGLNTISLRDSEMLNKAIENKTLIALASDHFGNDIEIEFFGRKTTAVKGPVLLGLKHKIPIILAYTTFENGEKVRIVIDKVIEIEKKENLKATLKYNTQKIYNEFENIIRKYPGQYMWQHKRWRD